MATLADPKTSHESNALKGVSLDHLGPIAARICQALSSSSQDGGLKTLQDVRSLRWSVSVDPLTLLFPDHRDERRRKSGSLGDRAARRTLSSFAPRPH